MNSDLEKLFLTGTPEGVDKMLTFFSSRLPIYYDPGTCRGTTVGRSIRK
jgi:hypothetical protein